MSDPLATYTFLPWLRNGLANNITQADNDSSVILRASIPIQLTISATDVAGNEVSDIEPIERIVELYGPGDIVGIDSKAIVKTEPRNWITNFEPNYLPYIEFYDEDFPWRYTPAGPDGNRLRPWLTLVVLKEGEFEDGQNIKDKPLPFFKLKEGKKTAELFPKPSELWAWAHVHVNIDLSNDADPNTANADDVITEISDLLGQNPDQAYSRIICPRKLETNVGYVAFLIPSFESGRLAGLGLPFPTDPKLSATQCAWDEESIIEFPYYHRWYFRTGNVGDFETLVDLLKPKPADKRVGVRDIDVLHPGSNLPPIDDEALKGVLKLGGALRVPFDSMNEEDQLEVRKYDEWDEPYPHSFTEAIAKRINLADDYVDSSKNIVEVNEAANVIIKNDEGDLEGDPDPVITSPLYGRWHALQKRLLTSNDLNINKNWVHELNLDPRFRAAAGLGTKVVQKGQEKYMQAAWEQVGKIIEANNKIRMAQMALEASEKLYQNHLIPLITERAFIFTAPVHKRVIYKNLTAYKHVEESLVPLAMTSGQFRSIIRPRGRVMKKLKFTNEINANNLIERVNEGKVTIVPAKTDTEGAINLTNIVKETGPQKIPGFIERPLGKHKWFKFLPLLILLLLLLIVLLFFRNVAGLVVISGIAVALVGLFNQFFKWEKEIKGAESLSQNNQTPEMVDSYPKIDNFIISTPGSDFKPSKSSRDSVEALKFKIALKGAFSMVNVHYSEEEEPKERKKLDFEEITKKVVESLNPAVTIPKRTSHTIQIPSRILGNMVEKFAPIMAYPEIDVPMYKPLAEMSSELFLPNINLIEQNSITLLENNQKFINAYMVGINHEASRELLWREFPTDQRGTPFRQFWDVSSFLPPQPVPDDIKERLRDISPIHLWSKTDTTKVNPGDPKSPLRNELGQHTQMASSGGNTPLVLVIRGELLKKYPTAVVYAHKADWGSQGGIQDVNLERVFVELSDAEKGNPPTDKLKTPLFQAKVEPDIYFFGFDLDDEEARGSINPTSINENPGWFFIIKERPGEPRFGADVEKAKNEAGVERFINWNNLSWKDIGITDGTCIELNNAPSLTFDNYDENLDQENNANSDDDQARWGTDSNAAELAYILYQVPVLVGIHASRMLAQ